MSYMSNPSYSLSNLKRPASNKRKKKRVGRGSGSGRGTYSGRGLKGQKSRTGGRKKLARRALFKSLLIRTPKLRGFKRQSAPTKILNLQDLEANFKDGQIVSLPILRKRGLARLQVKRLKILGKGTLTKKLKVSAQAFSQVAKNAIEKAGGSVEIV